MTATGVTQNLKRLSAEDLKRALVADWLRIAVRLDQPVASLSDVAFLDAVEQPNASGQLLAEPLAPMFEKLGAFTPVTLELRNGTLQNVRALCSSSAQAGNRSQGSARSIVHDLTQWGCEAGVRGGRPIESPTSVRREIPRIGAVKRVLLNLQTRAFVP